MCVFETVYTNIRINYMGIQPEYLLFLMIFFIGSIITKNKDEDKEKKEREETLRKIKKLVDRELRK